MKINLHFSLPTDHWLVGALGGSFPARKALHMLFAELFEGLAEEGEADADAREHVLGLAKRAQDRHGEAYEMVHRTLRFGPGDPRFDRPHLDALLAKRLAELLAAGDEDGVVSTTGGGPRELVEYVEGAALWKGTP